MGKLEETLSRIGPLDKGAMVTAQRRQDQLTKPPGSLGRLEELSVKLAGITGQVPPLLRDKAIVTMAADHGVVVEGVSAYPQEVTVQMVGNFLRGGAGVNVLARQVGARVVVVDLGVAAQMPSGPGLLHKKVRLGSRNMAVEPALTQDEAVQAVEAGIQVVEEELSKGLSVVGTGDMGIGNTTPSSAITAVITGEPVAGVTGRGTGIDDATWTRKKEVIERAIARHLPDPRAPLDVLAKVGGLEIGGLVGVILGAAAHRIPVVLDGFISGAAALLAARMVPGVRDYLFASHVSAEVGHQKALRHLGLQPLLDLGLRLGEGTGAALGIFLLETAARLLAEMATFEEAGVSPKLSQLPAAPR